MSFRRYDLSIPLGLSAYLAYVVKHEKSTPAPLVTDGKKLD
jgi:hypothetical protein